MRAEAKPRKSVCSDENCLLYIGGKKESGSSSLAVSLKEVKRGGY